LYEVISYFFQLGLYYRTGGSMENQNSTLLKAQFLIAMPGLLDPNFKHTVSCICEHTDDGAMGIVINRVHPSLFAKDIFKELEIPSVSAADTLPIYMGGPVHLNEIFILHGPPFGWKGCFQISENLALSNSRDVLESISMGKGPEPVVIAAGCAGWGPGQLETELGQNAWLTGPLNEEIIFRTPIDDRWDTAVKKMGIDPRLLSNTAGHA
jgi:putative transcriptional regulator